MTPARRSDLERTEADYEVRLTERVRTWEKQNPEEAQRLREAARMQLGMPAVPALGSIRWLVLEHAFREHVRKAKQWPTASQWMRGET